MAKILGESFKTKVHKVNFKQILVAWFDFYRYWKFYAVGRYCKVGNNMIACILLTSSSFYRSQGEKKAKKEDVKYKEKDT